MRDGCKHIRRAQLEGLLLPHMPSYLHMLTTRRLHLAGSHAQRGKDGSPITPRGIHNVGRGWSAPATWGLRSSLSVLPSMARPRSSLGRRVNERNPGTPELSRGDYRRGI